MIRRTARTLALVLATSAALAVATATAHAERVVLQDDSGDVWSPDGPNDFTAEGSVANTDLLRTWVRHQDRSVVVKARYVDLKKRVSDEIEFHAYLRTDRPRLYEVSAQVDWLGRETSYRLVRYSTGKVLDCGGLTGRTRFGVNTLRITVPRACLGNPRWVRFQGKAESYAEEDGLFIDDAQVAGPKSQYATAKPWTLRLAHG
jgi:hypothetical protein